MRNVFSRLFTKAAQAISIIPNWLAGVRWYINDRFLTLVKEGYKQNAVVYACIQLLAKSVPEAPLRIYTEGKDGSEEHLVAHPAQRLIKNPNPLQTEFEFWELAIIQLSCVGRSHWWKERTNSGQVKHLWPLRPDRVTPVYATIGVQSGWDYQMVDGSGWSYRLPLEDVFTLNYPDPEDVSGGIVEGLGPLQVLAREVDTDNAATRFVFALVNNYAMPGVVITTKARMNADDAAHYKAEFKRRYGGMQLGEPAILDGDTKVEKFSFSLADLEFPALRSIAETRIAAAFGVPPILVGLKAGLDRSTFRNAESAEQFFTLKTLSAIWRRLQDQYTNDIVIKEYGDEAVYARFDTSKVRDMQQQESERYAEAFKVGAATRNEYRTRGLGMPAVPDGDVYLLPVGMVEQPLGQLTTGQPATEKARLLSGAKAKSNSALTTAQISVARRWLRKRAADTLLPNLFDASEQPSGKSA